MEKRIQQPEQILKWWVKNVAGIVIAAFLLLFTSGQISWLYAWLYIAVLSVIIVANALSLDKGLMAERSSLQKGTQRWDLVLSVFVALLGPIVTLAVAGLDKRFELSAGIPSALQVTSLLIILFAGLLGTWSMKSNHYFSSTVRLQTEREHRVAQGGPYRFIRHPGYTGGIISMIATPAALGSWVAFIPAFCVVVGYIIRTRLEDVFLKEELEGYDTYADKVRYRLLPWIW